MNMQQMLERLLPNQEETKADQARMEAKMDDNQAKAAKEEEMLAEISARMDTNINEMREEIKSGQAEMRSTTCTFQSELKETIQRQMKAVIQPIRSELDETTACNGETETELDPRMMQSVEDYQEMPKGKAAVMPVGEPRERCRVRNLAAERRQKRKERTRGNFGSKRKSAAAYRKVSRRAKVAWREINLNRKIWIQASRES
jgi:hypothetical protein